MERSYSLCSHPCHLSGLCHSGLPEPGIGSKQATSDQAVNAPKEVPRGWGAAGAVKSQGDAEPTKEGLNRER